MFTGPKSLFPTPDAKITPASITDGFSNTWLIVEAGEAVPWTKPEDIRYDADKPVAKLGGMFPEGFHALYADGRVEFIKKTIKDAVMHKLINPADGEVIPYDEVPTIPPRRDFGPRRTTGKPDVGTRPRKSRKISSGRNCPPRTTVEGEIKGEVGNYSSRQFSGYINVPPDERHARPAHRRGQHEPQRL